MSSSMSNILLDKEILLESGTNELELLVFDVADYTFGINVAKVREVLPITQITALPRAHSSVRGVFKLRNRVIPCVSLMDHLGITPTRDPSESTIVLTDFNQQQTAFLVDEVERIHRLSWEHILAVPGMEALSSTPVTALARCENRLIVMLDFEMILDDVTDQLFRTDPVENPLGLPREQLKIVLADDSPTVREAIANTLQASGYTDLLFFENGAEAWQWFDEQVKTTEPGKSICDLVISDVEMPQVDGFHLTKRIKEHPALGRIPVLLYSSIITPDNFKKGKAVRADDQISKPELDQVVGKADELISAAQKGSRASGLQEVAGMVETPAVSPVPEPSPPTASVGTDSREVTPPGPGPGAVSSRLSEKNEEAPQAPTPQATEQRILSDSVPAPKGVNESLWRTFRNELIDLNESLEGVLQQATGSPDDAVYDRVARLLHRIKSAAMVIPLDPIAQITHTVESLIAPARADRSRWPQRELDGYLRWLQNVAEPPGTVDDALAADPQ